jgi:hypothetical protein
MMPVIKPAATGIPEAIATPMHKGSATRNTTMEASRSFLMVLPLTGEVGGTAFMELVSIPLKER